MTPYYFYMILAALMWGGSFVGTKVALESISPLTLIFARYVIGGVVTIVFSIFVKYQKIERKDLKWLILLCIFEPGLYFLFETYGIRETDPTVAALIIALIPVFVLIIAAAFGIERITLKKVVGVIMSIAGVSIISLFENSSSGSIQSTIKGIILVFMATITASSFTVLLSRLAKKYDSFTLASFQIVFTIVFYLPLSLYENYPFTSLNWSLRSIWALLYLGVFPTFFAYFLYAKGLSKIEGSVASLFTNLIPIFTAIFSAIVLKTTPTIYTYVGGVLIIGGVTIVTRERNPELEIPLTT